MGALLTSIIVGFLTFAILVLINTILAYAVHLYGHSFDWNEMLEFMKRRIAVYVLCWAAFSGINLLILWLTERFGYVISLGAVGTMTGLINAFSALIVILLGKKILEKISELGISIQGNNTGQ